MDKFRVGQSVVTTQTNGRADWADERIWGEMGVVHRIDGYQDSFYLVELRVGGTFWYEEDELKLFADVLN